MDNFTKAEISSRPKALAILKEILLPGFYVEEAPPEAKTHYDFIIKRKDDDKPIAYVEYKDRQYTSTDFSDWLLGSRKKYYLDQIKLPTYYLNTFTDGVWAMWDTKKTSFTRKDICHSVTTVSCSDPMVECGYFYSIEDGKRGTYDVNEYETTISRSIE